MIGLKKTRRGDRVLVIDTYTDIDKTVDVRENFFDCVMIKAKDERNLVSMLYGASPILSSKCSYKPIFASVMDKDKALIDNLIDLYTDELDTEKVYDVIDRIKTETARHGIKREKDKPRTPNQLFSNICRYMLTRGIYVIRNSVYDPVAGMYINPIFEHYHRMGLFRMNQMIAYKKMMVRYGVLRVGNSTQKNDSHNAADIEITADGIKALAQTFEALDSEALDAITRKIAADEKKTKRYRLVITVLAIVATLFLALGVMVLVLMQ